MEEEDTNGVRIKSVSPSKKIVPTFLVKKFEILHMPQVNNVNSIRNRSRDMEVNKVLNDLEITPQRKGIEHDGIVGPHPRQAVSIIELINKTKPDSFESIGRIHGLQTVMYLEVIRVQTEKYSRG